MSASATPRPWPATAVALLLGALAGAGCSPQAGLDSADPSRRAAAVRSLDAGRGDPPLAAILVAQADPSPEVRLAAADALGRAGGARAAEGLGAMLADADPTVVAAAARHLASLPPESGAKERLLDAYGRATRAGRAAIADALDRMGVALREAVEVEARQLWERHVEALEGATGGARAGAAEELGESGRTEAVTRLLTLLGSPAGAEPRLAAAAARGLGASGLRAARPALELLLESRQPEVAEAAADGLRRLGDPGAADALAAVAEGSGLPAAAALHALESLPRAPEVGAALCAVAVRSRDPAAAAAAGRLASLRDHPCPERPLLARIGRPGELAALAALGELRLDPAAAVVAARRVLPLLGGDRGGAELRVAAATALAGLGWPEAAGPLLDRAMALSSRLEAGRAAAGTRAPPDPAGATPAPPFPDPPAARELGALLAAAGRLRAPGAEPLLVQSLADPAPSVRAGAVEGLAWIRGERAAGSLGVALVDPSPLVRRAAARALGRLGPAGAGPLVRAAAASSLADGAWRTELANALGDAAGPEATTGLAALLDGESAAPAAEAMARVGASAAARPLADLVARPDAPALAAAIEALAQVGGPESGPVVAVHLTSDRADVREAAVRALGRLRHEPASARLEALRGDYSGRVRRAALEALAKLPMRRPDGRP